MCWMKHGVKSLVPFMSQTLCLQGISFHHFICALLASPCFFLVQRNLRLAAVAGVRCLPHCSPCFVANSNSSPTCLYHHPGEGSGSLQRHGAECPVAAHADAQHGLGARCPGNPSCHRDAGGQDAQRCGWPHHWGKGTDLKLISETLILKDSSVRSIWTYLTASPCCTTNTNKHDCTINRYYKHVFGNLSCFPRFRTVNPFTGSNMFAFLVGFPPRSSLRWRLSYPELLLLRTLLVVRFAWSWNSSKKLCSATWAERNLFASDVIWHLEGRERVKYCLF